MAKPLSEQLSDLSVSAKKAEDAVAAARKEAQEKVIARREQAHTAAAAAIQKVDRDIKSAGDSVKSAGDAVVGSWRAFQAKVSADMDALNAKIALGKRTLDVKHAEHRAGGIFRGRLCRRGDRGGKVCCSRCHRRPHRRRKSQESLNSTKFCNLRQVASNGFARKPAVSTGLLCVWSIRCGAVLNDPSALAPRPR
jgi:hypothetical protein